MGVVAERLTRSGESFDCASLASQLGSEPDAVRRALDLAVKAGTVTESKGALPRGARLACGHRSLEEIDAPASESPGDLRAPAHSDRPRGRRCRRGAAGLEISQPSFDRGLPKTSIAAKANVRNPAGTCLGPDPLGLHAEALGDLVAVSRPIHGVPSRLGRLLRDRDEHLVASCRCRPRAA